MFQKTEPNRNRGIWPKTEPKSIPKQPGRNRHSTIENADYFWAKSFSRFYSSLYCIFQPIYFSWKALRHLLFIVSKSHMEAYHLNHVIPNRLLLKWAFCKCYFRPLTSHTFTDSVCFSNDWENQKCKANLCHDDISGNMSEIAKRLTSTTALVLAIFVCAMTSQSIQRKWCTFYVVSWLDSEIVYSSEY
jgi:hypothetical protein